MKNFCEVIDTVEKLEDDGVDVYSLCIAKELFDHIRVAKRKFCKTKELKAKADNDIKELYILSLKTHAASCGASTIKDVVQGIVSAYFDCGMDVEQAYDISKSHEFVSYQDSDDNTNEYIFDIRTINAQFNSGHKNYGRDNVDMDPQNMVQY